MLLVLWRNGVSNSEKEEIYKKLSYIFPKELLNTASTEFSKNSTVDLTYEDIEKTLSEYKKVLLENLIRSQNCKSKSICSDALNQANRILRGLNFAKPFRDAFLLARRELNHMTDEEFNKIRKG